jgi:hypothetical protein
MCRLLITIGWCALAAQLLTAADDVFTAEKAKVLIPEAAGVPSAELRKLAEASSPTTFSASNGESLTWWLLTYHPGPNDPVPTSIKFLNDPKPVNPAALIASILGPKDKDGKRRKYASIIHPEYIIGCTCKVNGETATGMVSFKADEVYEGKVEYTARKKDGAWRIEEFRVPDAKFTTTLAADGKWVKK